ncbi:MAG: right-handed parallel beta-helix repeat-containing protein [Pirellulales bacterium]|nr:right-handed parallel beta-helix repeat-containing protein [Pirellulales bacterium]
MPLRCLLPILALSMLSTPALANESTSADFHVAPNGDDGWSGCLPAPNAERTDGPLATLAAARDKVRLLKKQGPMLMKPVRVLFRGGTYRLDGPIRFTPQDSGRREAPIVYAARPGEKPIFSAAVPISGWKKSDGPLWTAVVPAVKEGRLYFRQLFVDGKRCTPARTPNDGYFTTLGPGVDWKDKEAARRNIATKKSIRCKAEDLASISDWSDAVAVVYHSWTTSRHRIESADRANNILYFTNPSEWPMGFFYTRSQRYFVEFVPGGVDAPGEWHLDRRSGVLTYYPRPGEDMTKVEAVAPCGAEELLRLEGDPSGEKFVEHLRFEGLSFQHSAWNMPREEMVDGFGADFPRTAAVHARGAKNCEFVRCQIAHTGGYALWLDFGCKRNRLEQCHLHDLGAGGVRIGQCKISDVRVDGVRVEKNAEGLPEEADLWAGDNDVYNCFIHDGGRVFQAGIGVIVGRCSNNRIRNNEICDFNYSGVSVGWSWWNDPPSYAHHNLVEYNHIHHLGWGRLSDMGGVYTLGYSPGTIIRNNLIHDILAYSRRGWGLYPDEGTAEAIFENNIVYRTTDGAIHDHLGRDNIVQNNIFAFSATRGQITRNPEPGVCSFDCRRNIVYDVRTPPLGGDWTTPSFKLDYNLYWHTSKEPLVFPGDRTFRQWQQLGYDVHSVVAYPRFADAERFDFRLRPDSPALMLGFKPIDAGEIGLVGPAEWVELPKKVERPAMKLPGE